MARGFKQNSKHVKNGSAKMPTRPSGAPAAPRDQPADWRVWLPLCVVVFVLSCGFLFFRLGYYPFWGDEADTALFARGVARSGDTLGFVDHNLYAFRNGACLKNLRGRYQPPVPYYFAAPFVGANGTNSLWPRIPFAFCGLLCVVLLLFWMWRSRLTASAWIAMSAALLGNVSFFLFCRQCRYYSLTFLLSLAIAYLYLNWRGRRWEYAGIVLASILLLGTSYMSYGALYAALACDWLLFARRQRQPTLRQCLMMLVPQVLLGAVIIWIYNPLGANVAPDMPAGNMLINKLTLIWRGFRDLNNCELCVGTAMLAAPLAYLWTRNVWILRGLVAVVCYTVTCAVLSPQHIFMSDQADVRYLAPLIPLCAGISALVIVTLAGGRWYYALPLSAAVFGFTVFNFPFSPSQWRSRPVDFVKELCYPRATATRAAIEWVDENVRNGESVWVLPDYLEAVLMYHAPHPVYAWHLTSSPPEQFASLPPIHRFKGALPDYFLIFGGGRVKVETLISFLKSKGIEYQLEKIIDVYWDDKTRPEIFWRFFQPVESFNRRLEGVYIYRRISPPQDQTPDLNNIFPPGVKLKWFYEGAFY
jgi:hypothetical protein